MLSSGCSKHLHSFIHLNCSGHELMLQRDDKRKGSVGFLRLTREKKNRIFMFHSSTCYWFDVTLACFYLRPPDVGICFLSAGISEDANQADNTANIMTGWGGGDQLNFDDMLQLNMNSWMRGLTECRVRGKKLRGNSSVNWGDLWRAVGLHWMIFNKK